ncbi:MULTISPECIES: hypothetical protein [Niastella]|uniref:Uncharacterized protein n=1 Tax=Niastella soli TaxID=2821487 RepID=A0ABS3Z3X2_9BACT|nr:hypothetical protein [Niastella soli]MBO9204856.1 hypothetical protein [Niastella soli]
MYNEFNKYIFNSFFGPSNVGESICLSIDDTFINKFCQYRNVEFSVFETSIKQKLSSNWAPVISCGKEDIPNYLGLLVMQVYAAYLMRDDNEISEKAYNPRLIELLGIENISRLNMLYRAYQDTVWSNFRKWCITNGYLVNLPAPKTGKGCNIQYPLSQALLNKEDFKSLSRFFHKRKIKPKEQFSYSTFCKLVFKINKGEITAHYDRLYNRHLKEGTLDYLNQQVFSFYCNWDGNIEGTCAISEKNINGNSRSSDKVEIQSQILVVDHAITSARILNEWDNELYKFNIYEEDFFLNVNSKYDLPYDGVIVFKKDKDYNDWVETRFVNKKDCCLIIIDKSTFSNKNLNEIRWAADKNHSYSHLYAFEVNLAELSPNSLYLLGEHIDFDSQTYFSGGLKLRRNVYMKGAGPEIVFNGPVDAWLNSVRVFEAKDSLKYDATELEVGEYVLKVENETPKHFAIQDPIFITSNSKEGWQISRNNKKWDFSKSEPNFHGLYYLGGQNLQNSSSEIRNWINNIIFTNREKYNDSLILIEEAKKRAKYGIKL